MAAEGDGDLRDVGVDVEHAAVVVAHEAEAVVRSSVSDVGGGDPVVDLVSRSRSSSSMPVTWWKGMPARLKTLAISGTGQAEQ